MADEVIYVLRLEFNARTGETKIELPESAIIAAGLVGLANAAVIEKRLKPAVAEHVMAAAVLPHGFAGKW